jgi:hypothetical protein
MIALIRLRPPQCGSAGTVKLSQPPKAPAARYSGALIRCSGDRQIRDALNLYSSVRATRPLFTFGIVAPPDLCMRPFASFDHPLTTVATPDELIDGRVPLRMIDELRAKSIEAPILQALIDERGDTILKEERLLTTIIPHAMRGGKLTRMAKDFGVSSDTLRRRIRALGWQPAHLVSFIRVRAYEIRVAAGVSPGAALLAGGWTDPEAKRKVARRLARNRIHPS